MGNCLVTQLKESVSNDNLEIFGTIVVKRLFQESGDDNDKRYISISAKNSPIVVTTDDNGYFTSIAGDASEAGVYRRVEIAAGETMNGFTTNANFKIFINKKYYAVIDFLGSDYSVNIDDYYHTPQSIIQGASIYGHLNKLNPNKITRLNIQSPDIIGTIDDICKLKKLTKLTAAVYTGMSIGKLSELGVLTKLAGENTLPRVNGQIEDFVNVQRTAAIDPRTSLSSPLTLYDLGVRGNVYIYNTQIVGNAVITWTENTITVNGTTYDSNGNVVS